MVIAVGDKVPDAKLSRMGDSGPEKILLGELLLNRKVVVFALPGAFTPTCSSAHVPSFIGVAEQLREKGVEEIICISVNDPHVMKAWGQATGGTEAGITFLSDADGSYTKSVGMDFDAPVVGFFGRSKRYSMLVEDGSVTELNLEVERGCELSGGETMLAQV